MKVLNLTIRKHWSVYVWPSLIILVAIFAIYVSFSIITKWLSLFLLIFGTLGAISKAIKLLYLSSVKWTFNGGELQVSRGFLPWKKTHIQIPIFDIYDSSVSSGFLGHYLNFANISIRRTEGMTSQLSDSHLARAVTFSGILNQYVQEYKKGKNADSKNDVPVIDLSQEIQKLTDLKNTGAITQEEFEKLKKKLIDS